MPVAISIGEFYALTLGTPSPPIFTQQEELKRFHATYGHCNVPQKYEENKQLGAWVRTQKQQYKLLAEGKPSHMSQARIELLNELGFEWSGEKRDKFWSERYAELMDFQQKHNSTRVPDKYPEAPQLHSWVSLQRRVSRCFGFMFGVDSLSVLVL